MKNYEQIAIEAEKARKIYLKKDIVKDLSPNDKMREDIGYYGGFLDGYTKALSDLKR